MKELLRARSWREGELMELPCPLWVPHYYSVALVVSRGPCIKGLTLNFALLGGSGDLRREGPMGGN